MRSIACIMCSITLEVYSIRAPKLTVMSRGQVFERSSLRRALPRESWGVIEIFAHKVGVSSTTSAQYRLRKLHIKMCTRNAGEHTHQTSINVDIITGSSSPMPRTPMTNIDDKSSLGRRRTGDCMRTARSRCDSSSWRSLINVAILESSELIASRRYGMETLGPGGPRAIQHSSPESTRTDFLRLLDVKVVAGIRTGTGDMC